MSRNESLSVLLVRIIGMGVISAWFRRRNSAAFDHLGGNSNPRPKILRDSGKKRPRKKRKKSVAFKLDNSVKDGGGSKGSSNASSSVGSSPKGKLCAFPALFAILRRRKRAKRTRTKKLSITDMSKKGLHDSLIVLLRAVGNCLERIVYGDQDKTFPNCV